jgi:hypothetical protein
MPELYMNTVAQVMDRGLNTNSYKFALLRSLAAFGQQPGQGDQLIGFDWLAGKFIEFYWPLTLRFQIRQATVPGKDPVVMRLIREEVEAVDLSPETRLSAYQKLHPDRHRTLVAAVARKVFDDVIPRFHNIGREPIKPRLYSIEERGILVGVEVRRFLQVSYKVLDLLAIGAWVKFTERYTSAPRLYEKIQGLEPARRSLGAYREFLAASGSSECFYCSSELGARPDVDHLVPWAFVAEDKSWNLVLACVGCNGSKSSMTPQDNYIEKLVKRNATMMAMDSANLPSKIEKELAEWQGRDLEEHVRVLVNRCRSDGFGTWHPPSA